MNQDVRTPRPITREPQRDINTTAIEASKPDSRPFTPKRRYKNPLLRLIATIVLILVVIAGVIALYSRYPQQPKQPLSAIAKEYQAKLPDLKKKVDAKPKDAAAHQNYAVALYATGDLKAAQQQYEAATKLNPKDATAFNNLGNTYRDLHQTDKAIAAYKQALALNPKSLNTYANLANIQLYAQDKPNDAIATYQAGLKQLPNNSQLELLLGIAYEQAKDPASAKKTYEHILSYDPENTAAQSSLDRLNK